MDPAWAWRVLGLVPGASPDDVRRAFRTGAQLLHPDRVAELGDDVRKDAQRRMAELAEAYRMCSAMARGAPPPPPRGAPSGPLRPAGDQAGELLAEARAALARSDVHDAYRRVVQLLEHVADAWPGTAEGDAARVLLVTSAAAVNALSARERAGHLALVVDPVAREAAFAGLAGRDELAVAQVIYAHPTADAALRKRARTRLVELGDWATVAADEDDDVRMLAAVHLLLNEARGLTERAAWLTRRERPAFDADLADWRRRVEALPDSPLSDELRRAEAAIRERV